MQYIVLDLEFNQDIASLNTADKQKLKNTFEIIQIGAIKLDSKFNTVSTFDRYIKPVIYMKINSFVAELTGITTEKLLEEETFTEVFNSFVKFIDDTDSIFCIWGMSDIKEIFKNVEYNKLNLNLLPRMFINLQPYVSTYLNLPHKKQLRLEHAVELLGIEANYKFHNAFYDAYYTAEIFKKINNPYIIPRFYDPKHVIIRPRQRKQVIEFDKLIKQFEKMYSRELTVEEQEMIKLAYKMGKTKQFLK
nr:3'-5' exonuclease [Sedimentibacter sp.]